MSRPDIKPMECERQNLLRTLDLLNASPDEAVSSWLSQYDWTHANSESLGWVLTNATSRIRDKVLEQGIYCSNTHSQWHQWSYALPALIAQGDWELMERFLTAANQKLLTPEIDKELREARNFYYQFPGGLAENILVSAGRDTFVARFVLAENAIASAFLKMVFFDFSEKKRPSFIERLRDVLTAKAKGKENARWALESFSSGPRDLRSTMKLMIGELQNPSQHKKFLKNLQTAVEIIDGHLNGQGGLGIEDVYHRPYMTPKLYTGQLILDCVNSGNFWSSVSPGKSAQARDIMAKMLSWHPVPGFNSPSPKEIVENLAGGANLWTDKLAKKVGDLVEVPSAEELGLLLTYGQSSHIKERLKRVTKEQSGLLDEVIPLVWKYIFHSSRKPEKKVAQDAVLVLSSLSASRLGELLEMVRVWQAEESDASARVRTSPNMDHALWLRVIEHAWLMKSTPTASSATGSNRPQRL